MSEKEMSFDRLFKQIVLEEEYNLADLYKLIENDFPVITASIGEDYNSMTGSGGGFVLFFKKPTAMSLFRADRYTLELIEKKETYTLSYFSKEYNEQVIFLGTKSGRDSEKMKEVKLTSIQTPSENISFKEARLIIECKLTIITTVNPDDLYSQEAKEFTNEEYKDPNHYRKLVFGEITDLWVKK